MTTNTAIIPASNKKALKPFFDPESSGAGVGGGTTVGETCGALVDGTAVGGETGVGGACGTGVGRTGVGGTATGGTVLSIYLYYGDKNIVSMMKSITQQHSSQFLQLFA